MTKLIEKPRDIAIEPFEMLYLVGGGLLGFGVERISRAYNQKAWSDLVGVGISLLSAMYAPKPLNIVGAGVMTGLVIGVFSDLISTSATRMVAMSKRPLIGVVETRATQQFTHRGAIDGLDRAPNSPYVGMIQPNVLYQRGVAGYQYNMQRSGPSTSYSVKAPMYNGGRYTV